MDRDTGAKTNRKAGGIRIGYGLDSVLVSTGLEYRFDETQQLTGGWSDRVTYVLRNNAKYQITPDWRVVGKLNYALSDSSLGQILRRRLHARACSAGPIARSRTTG